jgi:UMF1 family MFS transporter
LSSAERARRRSIVAWIGYDVGLHGYGLMIPATAFAIYFAEVVAADTGHAETWWAIAVALSLVFAGLLAPWVGALADAGGRRQTLLAAVTLVCGAATAMLATVGRGDVAAALGLFVLAQAGATLGGSLCNAWLPGLALTGQAARLSGLAWGVSFLGGVACFFLTLPFTRGGLGEGAAANFVLAFPVTAVFVLALALPAVAMLPAAAPGVSAGEVAAPYRRVWATIKSWRHEREVPKFLLAYYLINDAIVTVIFFTGVMLKKTFGLEVQEILLLSLAFQAIAIPSTIFFGWLGSRWSERGAVYVTLALWLCTLATVLVAQGRPGAIAIALSLGLVLGSTQSLLRSLFVAMVPSGRESEYFGFHALVGRASSALGPLFFGAVSLLTGSQRVAMASLAVFFVAGGMVLAFVRVPRPPVGAG